MKNRNFIKNSIALLLPSVLSVGVLFGIRRDNAVKTDAYASSNLPTTIDLNDCSENDIRNYYSALNSKSSNELQGQNLLKNLKPILSTNQKYYKYDGGSLWAMYEISDRDWEKSPASSTTYGTYDSVNNKLINYQYGNSASNSKNNPFIHALYVDRDVDNLTTAWDDHQQTQWGINQEHIWPKSQGFNASGEGGVRGDPMHLWAGNGRVNGTEHNNNMYGFVDKTKEYTNPFELKGFENLKDNYSGYSLTIPTSTDIVFEPQDCDKGDIARSIFYLVARYNNIAGTDDNIDQNNPNLALKQTTKSLGSYTTTSANGDTGYMGLMTDLLIWNHMDPVDDYEIHRNNLLYKNFTNNRNPFIDFPEWADYIWGKPNYSGREFVSYSSTPTGSVDLSTDKLNGFKNEVEVTVEDVVIEKEPNKVDYFDGEDFDKTGMVVKAVYSDGSERTITAYSVSPNEVLTTSDTSVGITFGGITKYINITVAPSTKVEKTVTFSDTDFTGGTVDSGSEVSYTKENVTFSNDKAYADEVSDPNVLRMYKNSVLTISATRKITEVSFVFADKSNIFPTNTFSNIDSKTFSLTCSDNKVLIKSVSITYTDFIPQQVEVTGVTVSPSSTSLEVGENVILNAKVLPTNASNPALSWSSSNEEIAIVNDSGKVTAIAPGTATIYATSVSNGGIQGTATITVKDEFVLSSLDISGSHKTQFVVGDEFNSEGIVVNAIYTRTGETKEEEVTEFVDISAPDMSTAGTKQVEVSYQGVTEFYTIDVVGINDENTVIFDFSSQNYENKEKVTSLTISEYTVTFSKDGGSSDPAYYTTGTAIRCYGGNTITIEGDRIVGILFVFSTGEGANTLSTSLGTCDANTGAWFNTAGVNSLTYTIGGTSGHRRIKQIIVSYDPNETPQTVTIDIPMKGFIDSEKTLYFNENKSATYSGVEYTSYGFNNSNGQIRGNKEFIATSSSNAETYNFHFFNSTKLVNKLVGVSVSSDSTNETNYFTNKLYIVVGDEKLGDCTSIHGAISAALINKNTFSFDLSNAGEFDYFKILSNEKFTVGSVKNVVISLTFEHTGKLLSKIALSGEMSTEFNVDDEFNYEGLVVTATYSDNSSATVTPTSVSTPDLSTEGEKEVTVSYTENGITKTASYQITVTKVKASNVFTVEKTVNELLEEKHWTHGDHTCYTSFDLDDFISVSTSGSANCGGIYGSGTYDWRLYQNKNGDVTISCCEGIIKSINLTFSSENTATLLNGNEAVTSGKDINVNSNSITLTVGNSNINTTNGQIRITKFAVTYENIKSFSLVTDLSDINTGDLVVIAGSQRRTGTEIIDYYSLSTNRSLSTSISASQIEGNANVVFANADCELLTVERKNNLVSFKMLDGRYLASRGSSAGIDAVDSNESLDAQWALSLSDNNSVRFIANNPEHSFRKLLFNYANETPIFKCYTESSSNGVNPFIFKYTPQVEADTWAKDFLSKTYNCTLTNWSDLASSYAELSKCARREICNVLPDYSDGMNYRSQAMARYEYILSDSRFANKVDAFIPEKVISPSTQAHLALFKTKSSTNLILIVSLIGVTTIGGYVFSRRKKEE